MYCRQCGNKCEDNVRFCGGCGTSVGVSPPSYAPYPQPVPYPAYSPYVPPQKKQTWWIWLVGGLGVFALLIVVAVAAAVASYNAISNGPPVFPPYTTRAGQNEPPVIQDGHHTLPGIWNWDEDPAWQYFFHPDGEGTRGGAGVPVIHFDWRTQGNVLYITTDQMEERWTFVISNNRLTLASVEVPGMSFTYTRNS